MIIRRSLLGVAVAALSVLAACGGDSGNDSPGAAAAGGPTGGSSGPAPAATLSLVAQVGQKAFFDATLSGGRNMSCATCHSPQYAYGPPNSLAVQLGSDPTKTGTRAVPSLRYKDATPPYSDQAANPDGVTLAAPGGGFMWDGRAPTLAEQVALPLLNPLEMNAASKSDVVQAVRNGSYAALFTQAFGSGALDDTDIAFANIGSAIQAFEHEDVSFHPYSSKYDLLVHNKVGGTLTAAEERGLRLFNGKDNGNCSACHYAGVNFDGNQGLMTDFTYQTLGAPRNDGSIPGNPDAVPADVVDATYFDMGLCGPLRTDHGPQANAFDPVCGRFKVPTLRNAAMRGAFFHNGVFHSLAQVVHFYNTRDTNPEYWYPSSGGSGTPRTNPTYALQPSSVPGAAVATFNDLPPVQQGNVDEEVPLGTGNTASGNGNGTTRADGVQARAPGSPPSLSEQDVADIVCFLATLSDDYQPPASTPTSGTCVQ